METWASTRHESGAAQEEGGIADPLTGDVSARTTGRGRATAVKNSSPARVPFCGPGDGARPIRGCSATVAGGRERRKDQAGCRETNS